MNFWKNLFKRKAPPPAPAPTPAAAQMQPYVTQWDVYGMHLYRRRDEDSTVYYVDEANNIRKMIVDAQGRILDFPGIQREDFWASGLDSRSLEPQIRFRTDFERYSGRIRMLWQVQPDGRYWEDGDGFGGTSDEEITLYAFLTEDGSFDGPFRIYRVGDRNYYKDPKPGED